MSLIQSESTATVAFPRPHAVEIDPQEVLDSLSAHVAVLDATGTIVAVNRAWRTCFAHKVEGKPCVLDEGADRDHREAPSGAGLGVNYLEVCRNTRGREEPFAQAALRGLEAVLERRTPEFIFNYSCAWPVQQRRFVMSVTPTSSPRGGAIVAHYDLTDATEIPWPPVPSGRR